MLSLSSYQLFWDCSFDSNCCVCLASLSLLNLEHVLLSLPECVLVFFSCFKYSEWWIIENCIPGPLITFEEKPLCTLPTSKYCFIWKASVQKILKLVPCKEDEPICCNESSDPDGPFCYFYTTVFKNVLLHLPMYNFEKALPTEINVAPA